MNALRNILVVAVVVMFVGVSGVKGAVIYTAETSGYGSIHALASEAGDYYCRYTTSGGFTVDGAYLEDVWAVILSEIEGQTRLNGYGYSYNGGANFRFTIFGDADNPYVPASHILPIINDDDLELLGIKSVMTPEGLSGELHFFDDPNPESYWYGEDIVLPQENLSIDGGEWGDISGIVFDYDNRGSYSLDSVAIDTTIPEPATMGLLVFGAVGILVRRMRR